jgi:hypothetical protein
MKGVLIGVGFAFVWGSALMPFIDLINSYKTAYNFLGYIGAAIVCASCSAIAIYDSSLESEVRAANRRIKDILS